jgi:hypothetical protein
MLEGGGGTNCSSSSSNSNITGAQVEGYQELQRKQQVVYDRGVPGRGCSSFGSSRERPGTEVQAARQRWHLVCVGGPGQSDTGATHMST